MCKRRQFWAGVLCVLTLILIGWNGQVQSQEKYPTRPIEIICPFAAGGGVDFAGRLTATFIAKKWGVPVNVVNKPGGNTIPANVELYSAAPNGYTMMVDGQQSTTMVGVVVKELPFKVMDRTHIAITTFFPMLLLVPSSSPFKTLEEVIAEAKRDPENFTWTSLGGASGQDTLGRQFFKAIGVDVMKTKPVMSKGGSEAAALTAGGHVKLGITVYPSVGGAIRGGTIRPLAVTRVRNPDLPDVRTTEELGYPTMNCANWVGFSGPPKLPSSIVKMWEKVLEEISNDPEYSSRLEKGGVSKLFLTSDKMKEYLIRERKEMGELFGISLEK